MSDDEYTPKETRLSDEEFKRLPQAVQLEIMLKRERKQANSAAFLERERKRAKMGFIYGLNIFLLAHAFVLANPPLLAAVTVAGGVAGYFIVKQRWNYLIAMLLFGGVSIVGSMIGLWFGFMDVANLLFIAACWGVLCGAAIVLVHMVEGDRRKNEVF